MTRKTLNLHAILIAAVRFRLSKFINELRLKFFKAQ